MQTTKLTLCFVCRDTEILLGMKRRGFGVGRWNGFGGKVEPGESITAAACREVKEEIGITVARLQPAGKLAFIYPAEGTKLDVHVFRAGSFSGTPIETDEMRPQWFAVDEIPYDQMWPDDPYWLPLFLAEKDFEGTFHFQDNDTILAHTVRER